MAALRAFRKFEGLFAIYKPPGVHWKLVRDTIETHLLKELNAFQRAPKQEVRFQALPSGETDVTKELTIAATQLPVLSTSHHVRGPRYRTLKVGVGHRLDAGSSGVLVLGVGHGNKALEEFYNSPITRDYTLEGEFGMATDDFTETGRVIERTTFEHVNLEKIEMILAVIQGGHQKALISYSGVDLQSQEAYELASRGMLYPHGKSPPILLALRCTRFQPPHFTLEVRCVNETQGYLRKLVHEVGLELRSSSVCTGVRRTRDGTFGIREALTRQHWTASDIQRAIKASRSMIKAQGRADISESGAEKDCQIEQQYQNRGTAEHSTASMTETDPKQLYSRAKEAVGSTAS
ncbi:mitochondrial mRNA pseudouridine synthase TRUB2 [Engraulis encrasicolus]|uniref:mitochondrial mRNA pseudouridine synthase TRUB2 n=1 Tax=Engraulis encrasicolus TaxID=184585 RepID=UPI002FD1E0EC